MNNAGVMRKNLLILLSCMIAGVFVSSCGLEEVITVEEPLVTYNNPLFSSSDPESWYFNFKTSSEGGENFVGTDVYYKIYNNSSTLTSEKSSILSVNTSTNSSAAATRMIETYKYQQLVGDAGDAVMFPKDVGSVTVIMRLKNYQNGLGPEPSQSDTAKYNNYIESKKSRYKWEACIGILSGAEYLYNTYIPYRYDRTRSFDFFDYDQDNKGGTRDVIPVDGDSDYKYSSTASIEDTYYIQMFAVGVALDPYTVSASYSLVLDLGSVPIRKGE